MPWLLPAPDLALAEWRGRLHAMTTHLKRQAAQYRAALRPDVTRPTTRNRLKLLAMACSDHARRLQALLAPLETEAEPAAAATYAALAPVVATAQGLASYYPNVHRDWVWGEEENQAALAAVRSALGSVRPERLLVLGCGAGRLPYDLHAILHPTATIAVDINPLLMAVARRMYAAERVDLYEFPIAPRDLASHALLRTLTAPARAEPGLHLVFGDAKQPPFAPGSFDTVVTPWLVDVVDTDLESLAAIVNSLLAPGGRWVCTGTLFFQQADPAQAVLERGGTGDRSGRRLRVAPAANVAPAVPGVTGEPARAGRGGRHVRGLQAARDRTAAAADRRRGWRIHGIRFRCCPRWPTMRSPCGCAATWLRWSTAGVR